MLFDVNDSVICVTLWFAVWQNTGSWKTDRRSTDFWCTDDV